MNQRKEDQFIAEVKSIASKNDYAANSDKLKGLRFYLHDVIIKLLLTGAEITPAIMVSREVFKISLKTIHTKNEILGFLIKSRALNSILDEK